ncbi:MAG TPA: hypothetical protein VFN35_28445 [Ktedonobacteraceae bacterium]|nr:hypothetical protein [Ktedonobacteraceae bacterium]
MRFVDTTLLVRNNHFDADAPMVFRAEGHDISTGYYSRQRSLAVATRLIVHFL